MGGEEEKKPSHGGQSRFNFFSPKEVLAEVSLLLDVCMIFPLGCRFSPSRNMILRKAMTKSPAKLTIVGYFVVFFLPYVGQGHA